MLLNFTLALGAAYVARSGLGLLQVLGLGTVASFAIALLALDGATYLAHRLLHQVPLLWRVHLVHHIDASVDATTVSSASDRGRVAFRFHRRDGVDAGRTAGGSRNL
jgi:sterol desaturase/sphingolipid hydroxylase (fatty acid hydroxylase superfamily)